MNPLDRALNEYNKQMKKKRNIKFYNRELAMSKLKKSVYPIRDTAIGSEDITNLKIALNSSKTIEELIEKV